MIELHPVDLLTSQRDGEARGPLSEQLPGPVRGARVNGEEVPRHVNVLRRERVEDPLDASASADFIYTDTWIDMQYFNDPTKHAEKTALVAQMQRFQINSDLIADHELKIMHDMPIHDGYEITPEMVRDSRSIIFQQAENRLHAQKGLLWWLYDQAGMISA